MPPAGHPAAPFRLFAHPLIGGELRLLAPYDAPALLALIEGDRDHFEQWLPWAREMHKTEDAAAFIARGTARYQEQGTPWVGIWSDQELVGGVLFWPIDDMGRHVEIGYWLSRKAGSRGLMTAAVAALLDFCFDELALNKVVIRCAVGNAPSRGVPLRLGFADEGTLREHLWLDGTPHDLTMYGLLGRDWAARRIAPGQKEH